jgi:L-fuconolactonase
MDVGPDGLDQPSIRPRRPGPAAGARGDRRVDPRPGPDQPRRDTRVPADRGGDRVRGRVGWVDLTDPAVGESIEALRAGPGDQYLVGVRHPAHDEPNPEWLARPDVRHGLAAVADAGLTFDLLVRPRELPAALDTVATLPELRFVIDHLGKPPIREHRLEPWNSQIGRLAANANTWCKLSGLVTEADWDRWDVSGLEPYVDLALDLFGPGRLLFGSDWPVCLLAATYEEVIGAARQLTAGLSELERAAIFGRSARDAYRLGAVNAAG